MTEWITPDEVKEHHDNGYEAGVAHERERIIALLGTCPCGCPIEKCECGCGEEPEFTRNELLVLIKGGNE